MQLKPDLIKALQTIRLHCPVSRKYLAEKIHVSIPKATNLIRKLEEVGIIELASGESSGGRMPKLLKLKDDLFYSVGIDIGSQFVRIGLFNMAGDKRAEYIEDNNIEIQREIPIDFLTAEIRKFPQRNGIPFSSIKAIGVCITGIVHEKEGKCLSLRNTPGWRELSVVKLIKEQTGIETVVVMDSVKAMAVAEKRFGIAKGINDFIVFNIGIGLGAGIVIADKLLSGERGTTGEIGHMHIRSSEALCICGNYGCLEAIASGWALIKKCKKAIADGVETAIGHNKPLKELCVSDIIEAAHLGDKVALTMLESIAKDLAVGIGSAINLLNPEKVILSGGIIRGARDIMIGPLMRGVKSTVIPWLQKNIDIKLSEIGEWDASLGVATCAADEALINLLNELFVPAFSGALKL